MCPPPSKATVLFSRRGNIKLSSRQSLKINRQIFWRLMPLPMQTGHWHGGHLCTTIFVPAVPLLCAACWPQSHRPTQPSPTQVATSNLALSPANLIYQVVREDGFKYWPQPNSPTVRICQGNYGAPTIFMEKRFFTGKNMTLYMEKTLERSVPKCKP